MFARLKDKASAVVPVLALDPAESVWDATLHGSLPFRLCALVRSSVSRLLGASGSKVGATMQVLAFLALLALAFCLGLPQFASDKEGLALISLGAAALWFGGRLIGGPERYRTTAVDMIVLTYLLTYLVATCASHYFLPSVKGFLKVAVYVVGYFAFVGILSRSRGRVVGLLSTLFLTAFAVALYGLYQYHVGVAPLATWEDPNVEVKGTRIYSTLGNPNLLAGYLIPMIPVGFGLSMAAAFSRHRLKLLPLLLLIAMTAAVLVATLLTGSRGGYIGMFAAIAGLMAVSAKWLWRVRPKSRPFILVGLVVVPLLIAAAVHFVPSFEQRLFSIFAGREHTSNSFRMNVWLASLDMFKDNWWFGVGPGNQTFRLAYGLYMRSGFDALGTYCVPLEIGVEAGVAALAAFGTLIVAVFARAHEDFWGTADGAERWLILGCTSALAGLMAHGLVDTVFYRPQVQFVFWCVVACLVATRIRLVSGSGPESHKPEAS